MSDAPRPVKVWLEPGTHLVCRCRRTARPPFCDGSHAIPGAPGEGEPAPAHPAGFGSLEGGGGSGRPAGPIEAVVETRERVAWCTCGASARAPWCDGSHRERADGEPPGAPA